MESQVNAEIPISSTPVVMLSPPNTQYIFHTPPDESLFPSFDIDVPLCAFNQAVDLDDGPQAFVPLSYNSEFVDFGKDSELGFSQDAQLKNEIDTDSATENRSYGFRVLEKGVSDLGENPVKKVKLGFHSAGSCSGVQSQKVEDGFGNCDERKVENGVHVYDSVPPKEVVEMENSVPDENVETEVVQNAGDVNLIMRKKNNSDNEIDDGSGTRKDLEELTANGSGPEKVERAKKFSVFVLETAKRCGVTFPRPSSWPANRKSKLFKFDDEVEK